jgi:hypothetical protein
LQRGVGLLVIDTVTMRRANLHADIAQALEVGTEMDWSSASTLAAVAYRAVSENDQARVEAWPEPLAIGAELPTMPLWLGVEICLPVRLESTYGAACRSLRIAR